MENLHENIIFNTDFSSVNSPVYYDCCVHCLCLAGATTFHYFENDITLCAGQLAVLAYPRQISSITISDDFKCENIIAPNDFLHGLLPANNYSIPGSVALTHNPVIQLDGNDIMIMSNNIRSIAQRISQTSHLFYREMIGSLLRTMIYDIFDIHARREGLVPQSYRTGYVVTRFFAMVRDDEPATHRQPSWYADKLNITVKYLGDTVKRLTGASVSDHINRGAAAILREYIEDTNLSISQIADNMNFSSLSYFNRFCKLHLGKSPSQLRRIKNKS